ncbi:Hsp70 family protein [Rhodococcus hoagii]|nr:Hsp70 family protein [Prescottella equi]
MTTVSEPRAAAHFYTRSDTIAAGDTIAVFDFGGGTLDIAVLTATDTGGFTVIAARGDNGLGGKNLDAIIRRWVDQELRESNPELLDYLRREAPVNVLRALEESIRRAKELLSEAPSATITVAAPGQQETLSLTRDEFDDLIAPEIDRAVSLTQATLADAGITGGDLKALYLTGGSSRIPLVHQRLAALGPIATLDDPKTVVARGALIATQAQAAAPAPRPATPPPATPVPASSWTGPQQPAPQRFPADVHADQPAPAAKSRKPLLIGAAALAAVVVIGGGIVAAQALGGGDSGADTTNTASVSPTTSSNSTTGSPHPAGSTTPSTRSPPSSHPPWRAPVPART